MRAAVFHKPKDIRWENVPDPRIESPRDAIVKVTSTAICGTDLHVYNGFVPQFRKMILGHEFMGLIEDLGDEVTQLKKGDRVLVPFPIACGRCFFCRQGVPNGCQVSNPEHWGAEGGVSEKKGGGLFGFTDLYGGYDGGQAEAVRVPFADFGLRRVPDWLTDEQVLFLTDILPTGWVGVERAHMRGGETVAVFGCGPVGLMAQKAAWVHGAKRVIAVDIVPYRLNLAAQVCKAEIINGEMQDPVETIIELTGGHGADVVVDAVGMEADRNVLEKASSLVHMQAGGIKVLHQCYSSARRGGHVSVLGIYGSAYANFPLGQWLDKGLSVWAGHAPVQNYIDDLMTMVESGRIQLDDIITHRLKLEEAPHAYEIFCNKQENCVKVILKP